MASITVTSTGYWGNDAILASGSWAALAFNDTVTIQDGAICTVDASQQTPTGIDVGVNVTCSAGFSSFRIVNSSTSTPLIFYGAANGTIQITQSCWFEIIGAYIEIDTSDGTADQTSSGWTTAGFDAADEPAVLEVETGTGTGVYEDWVNCGDLSLSDLIGVGTLGNFFSYNNLTGVITFGNAGLPEDLAYDAAISNSYIDVADASNFSASDIVHLVSDDEFMRNSIASISVGGGTGGSDRINLDTALDANFTTSANSFIRLHTGGNIPVNGAKIRVYNIGIGTKDSGGNRQISSDPSVDIQLSPTFGGNLDFSKCYFFGAYMYLYGTNEVIIDNVACLSEVYLRLVSGIIANHLIVSLSRYDVRSTPYAVNGTNGGIFNCEFNNCVFLRHTGYAMYLTAMDNVSLDSCFIGLMNRINANHRSIRFVTVSNTDLISCILIGVCLFDGGNAVEITDCQHSDSPNSADPGYTYYSLYLSLVFGSIIDNLSFIREGLTTSYTNGDVFGNNLIIRNSNYPSRTRWFFSMGNNTQLINSYVGSPTSYINLAGNGVKNMLLQNVTTKNFAGGFTTSSASDQIIKGIDLNGTDVDNSPGWSADTHFYEIRTALTTGAMGIIFNPKSPSGTGYVSSADDDLKWSLNGALYIVTAGGYIEYTWPHWVRGVTSFPAGGSVVVAGSGTGNFTYEYQIDVGSGWNDSWLTLNHTNLNSHTIDPDIGFRFKLKISHSAGSISDYLNRLNWTTTVDYTNYKYPEALVNITLQNVIDGSRYYVYNVTSSKTIASGLQSGSSDIVIPDVPYNGDATLLIRVRKGGGGSTDYKPFETNAILSSSGAIIWISQVLDDITV